MMAKIRRVHPGDEDTLAYIQTESWKAAFADIIDGELLASLTDKRRATDMYRRLLASGKGNGYILFRDGLAHCIAWWDMTREKNMPGYAELICIHSLREHWHEGFGSRMMETVLRDAKAAGYGSIMLWVFENNTHAIRFYEKHGFVATDRKQPAFGAVEVMYTKTL